ncbi:NAD(P)H-quinone oxidoreductase subunit 3 [Streptomyces sp. V17-9]|nr:NAD(P)H-quinone oxidoreductase subunit 3 [Streptomyces sp. V17-9]
MPSTPASTAITSSRNSRPAGRLLDRLLLVTHPSYGRLAGAPGHTERGTDGPGRLARRTGVGHRGRNARRGNGAADGDDAECGYGPPGWWLPVSGFTAALSLLGLALLAVAGVYGAARAFRIPSGPLPAQPFGSGLEPAEHAVSRFHLRWYTVTMLFLAFDMEMVFMYPWTLVISVMGPSAVIEMFVFLAVLLAGVVHAWREGALRWA